jgi:hypothetical protein
MSAATYRVTLAAVGPLVVAVLFGAVERLLSLGHSPLLGAVAGMTAPWLLLPFLVGAARPRREGNALLGIACVWLAIVACSAGAETGGDLIGHLTPARFLGYFGAFGLSHLPVLLGAAVSAPVYAVLGHRWRVSRSWLPALAATAPLVLEPAARWLASQSVLFWAGYPPVAWAETLTGLVLTAAAIVVSARVGSARVWPGRTRPNGLRDLLACLVRRTIAIAGIAAVAVAVIVFCAPPVFPQVYPAGNGTVGVVVTPDGRTAYVGNYGFNDNAASFPSVAPTLTPVDLATMRAGRPIEVAPSGWSIAYGLLSPDGCTFYAVVDNDDGGPLPLSDDPLGMTATPDGRNLLIVGQESVTETRLAPDGAPSRPVALPESEWGQPPSGFAMSPDGSSLYVSVADGEDPGGLSFVRL